MVHFGCMGKWEASYGGRRAAVGCPLQGCRGVGEASLPSHFLMKCGAPSEFSPSRLSLQHVILTIHF